MKVYFKNEAHFRGAETMEEMMLWYDDEKVGFPGAVGEAGRYFEKKYGLPATVCEVNASLIDEDELVVDGVRVVASSDRPKGTYLIGGR
jgi:hypothetical protein